MNTSGAVDLSLSLKEDSEVYFSVYNPGPSVQIAVRSTTSQSNASSDSGIDANLPLIAGIAGFFSVAVVGVIVGCVVFTCKRRNLMQTQVRDIEIHGISQEKVDSLYPQRRFDQLASFNLSDTCSVCLEHFKPSSEVRVLPCKHVYHMTCIDLWFRDNHVTPHTDLLSVQDGLSEFHRRKRGGNQYVRPSSRQTTSGADRKLR